MVRQVTAQRNYTVDWRFISVRMINAAVDHDSHFPPGYEAGRIAGLKLLRVAARVRADYGRDKVGPLYEAVGTQVFDTELDEHQDRGSRTFLEPILVHVGARALKLPRPAATAVEKALAYFETNAERMRYANHRALGHFVGSGAVESGCKAVIGQRLKLSGMRWSEHGAAAILALRCQQASHRWNQIWQCLNNQTSVA